MVQFPKEDSCCSRITCAHFRGKLTWHFIQRKRQKNYKNTKSYSEGYIIKDHSYKHFYLYTLDF